MKKLFNLILKLGRDQRSQDMVEYALVAGFIAVAGGAILPGISDNISIIFSKMGSLVSDAAGGSGSLSPSPSPSPSPVPSDRRYKRDVVPVSSTLDRVLKLEGVYYHWKRDEFPEMNFPDGQQIGLIAQDVERLFPEAVGTTEDEYKTLEYAQLVPVLIEAIKTQQQIIETQNVELRKMRSEGENLSRRLENLEKRIDVRTSDTDALH